MILFSNYAMLIIMAFMTLVMTFILLPRANASAKRILEVLEMEYSVKDGEALSGWVDLKGAVEFKHVFFKYNDAGDYALNDISFKINRGETVAFTGTTGSGKTSLVNLIPRFYDADEGTVFINGMDIKSLSRRELRNRIGYVAQQASVFSGTVSSNVSYGDNGREAADKGIIRKALSIAQCTGFVENMEGSYNAYVAQKGVNLSGGQRQRLAIARGIARQPEILIFDDCFSALDYKTEESLCNDLKARVNDATIIIVSQRIGTIKQADRIIVIDNGRIAGEGTHEELMEDCGIYRELAYSQLTDQSQSFEKRCFDYPPPLQGFEPGHPPPMQGFRPGHPPPIQGFGPGHPPPLQGFGPGHPPPLQGFGPGHPPPMQGFEPGHPPPMQGFEPGHPPPIHGTDRGFPPPVQAKNKRLALSNFCVYLSKYKWPVVFGVILSVAGAALNLIGPGKLREITEVITTGMSSSVDISRVLNIAVPLGLLYILGFVLNYLQGFLMITAAQKVAYNIRCDIYAKINRLPLKFLDSAATGDILSQTSNDTDIIGQVLTQNLPSLVSSLALITGSAALMILTNPKMAVSGIGAALTGFLLTGIAVSMSQGYFARQQRELGHICGHIEEVYAGHITVKAYNGEETSMKEFSAINDRLYACAWKSQFVSGLMTPLMMFISNFSYVVVCIAGAAQAVRGEIGFGTIVAFMLYIRLFTQPLQSIPQTVSGIQSLAASWGRVFEFLSEEEMPDRSARLDIEWNKESEIVFDQVRFGYQPNKIVIDGLSESIKPGDRIAIVGPTGGGKTTIINLLLGLYDIWDGKITIDGTNIDNITRSGLRSLFGVVLQDTWLFEGTMRENIIYNSPPISGDKLDKICEAANLTQLIRQLPNGCDTVLDESINLSQGQKQLISIARAMVKDAPLMILDEATASVDAFTEVKVFRAMDNLLTGRTTIVIAHRLSTIKNAGLILVLRDGEIIEKGTHDYLLKKNGFYSMLYNSQFGE